MPQRHFFILLIFSAAISVSFWAKSATAQGKPILWVGQRTESDCGRAVLASLLARKDGDIETAYQRAPAPSDSKNGFSILELLRLPKKLEFTLKLRPVHNEKTESAQCQLTPTKRAHLIQLGRDADAGTPFVLPVSVSSLSGHYVLLVGTANNEFQVLDPASPGVKSYAIENLSAMMCGAAYMALEVVNKPAKRFSKKP